MCVITKTAPSEGAHIIGQAINNTADRAGTAHRALCGLLSRYRVESDIWGPVQHILFPKDENGDFIIAASDFEPNLVCLNPFVHYLFDSAIIGFKPISYGKPDPDDPDKVLISVEWRYLPEKLSQALFDHGKELNFINKKPRSRRAVSKCKLNLEAEGFAEFLAQYIQHPEGDTPELGNGLPCVYLPSGRRIESGMVFDIAVYKDHAETTYQLLRLSWLVLRMASISGAAEAVDLLSDRPPEDWDRAMTEIQAQRERDLKSAQERSKRYHEELEKEAEEEEVSENSGVATPASATSSRRAGNDAAGDTTSNEPGPSKKTSP